MIRLIKESKSTRSYETMLDVIKAYREIALENGEEFEYEDEYLEIARILRTKPENIVVLNSEESGEDFSIWDGIDKELVKEIYSDIGVEFAIYKTKYGLIGYRNEFGYIEWMVPRSKVKQEPQDEYSIYSRKILNLLKSKYNNVRRGNIGIEVLDQVDDVEALKLEIAELLVNELQMRKKPGKGKFAYEVGNDTDVYIQTLRVRRDGKSTEHVLITIL